VDSPVEEKAILREKIKAQTAEYLARGKTIEIVPPGYFRDELTNEFMVKKLRMKAK
tara:strand:+ start:593 stop:760 length:168 start_codon:yes stop_codon:yes gene_type:complete